MEGMDYSFAITTDTDDMMRPKQPGGINGGMYPRGDDGSKTPVIVMQVDSCEQRLKDVQAAGGSVVVPLREVGEMGLYAQVKDTEGNPIAGAIVDLWHANTKGTYSYFDTTQSDYNLRRRIVTDSEGRYRARSIVPSGYGCPPEGTTQEVLNLLGRHGNRPAHIHFFISAPGYRHLTTQINLSGDEYLWDDFAYATRDGLVGDIRFIDVPEPVVAFERSDAGATLFAAFNLSARPIGLVLPEQQRKQIECVGLIEGRLEGTQLTLPPHGVVFAV